MNTILVIDDEPQLRILLKKALTKYGFKIETAENGLEGINKYKQLRYDLVLTDLTMPGKNGLDTIKELVALDPTVKIIAMTGGSDRFPEYYLPKCIEAGALNAITKPIRLNSLADEINKAINS